MSTLNSPQQYLLSWSKNKFFLRRKVGQEACGDGTPSRGLECQKLCFTALLVEGLLHRARGLQHPLLWGMWFQGWDRSPAGTTLIWSAPYLEQPDMARPLPAPGGGKKAEGRDGGKVGNSGAAWVRESQGAA